MDTGRFMGLVYGAINPPAGVGLCALLFATFLLSPLTLS